MSKGSKSRKKTTAAEEQGSLSGVKQLREILGQEEAVTRLERDLREKRFHHAYLFLGKRGIGKKALALSFARSILCPVEPQGFCGSCPVCRRLDQGSYSEFSGLFEEGGEKIRLEEVRDLLQGEHLMKYEGDYRIIFMENVERLTEEAANSLLKVLEEPHEGTIFLLTASVPDRVLPTIQSRTEKYLLRPLSPAHLEQILGAMGFTAGEYASLGTIDEALALLEDKGQAPSYEEFRELMGSRDLGELFALAESLSKRNSLRELLSYYEVRAGEAYRLTREELEIRIIRGLEEAQARIRANVNKRNALEYSFLSIGGLISE